MKQYPGFNPTANFLNYTLAIGAVVGFSCSAFGIPPANPFVAYFGSIVALLTLCAILFFRVIASLLHSSVPDAE
jgi:membrane associated rhomboid family serine protease